MTSNSYQELFQAQKERSFALRIEKVSERKKRLKKLKSWILSNKDRIYTALDSDLKKSKAETDIFEIFPTVSEINKALGSLNDWSSAKSAPSGPVYIGTSAAVLPEPKGTCLIIAPWNFPFQLMTAPLVSCLAAGNTAVLKPSENTPATSSLLKDMIDECFPANEVVVVEGAVKETQELLELPFDHIFFTGSTTVGKIIMTAAAKNLSSVTLELGGKSPTIIDKSADLKDAARKIAWGKFVNCGQTCIAPNHIFVHRDVANDFQKAITSMVRSQFANKEGDFEQTEQYPRMVHTDHAQKMINLIKEAASKGAETILGGNHELDKNFIAPTIMTNVDRETELWKEEVFGPILPMNTFSDVEEVIQEINNNPKPLAVYLFTKSAKSKKRFATETSSGSFVVNDVVLQFTHPHLAFGGVGASGFGKAHGYAGFLAFSNEKSILKQRTGLTNARLFMPPYSKLTTIITNIVTRYF